MGHRPVRQESRPGHSQLWGKEALDGERTHLQAGFGVSRVWTDEPGDFALTLATMA